MSDWKRRLVAGRMTCAAMVFAVGIVGCGRPMAVAKGTVTFDDGSPVTEGTVVFESADGDKPVAARGDIKPDGSFVLGTTKPGDGVPLGHYKALVSPKIDPNWADKKTKAPLPFDPRYSSFESSKLEFEVKSGVNEFPIKVTKLKK